jgi:hypothetical protein
MQSGLNPVKKNTQRNYKKKNIYCTDVTVDYFLWQINVIKGGPFQVNVHENMAA